MIQGSAPTADADDRVANHAPDHAAGRESLFAGLGHFVFTVSHPVGKGSARFYKVGCRCDDCREANNAQIRAYRQRRRDREAAQLCDDVATIIESGFAEGVPSLAIAAEVIALVKG